MRQAFGWLKPFRALYWYLNTEHSISVPPMIRLAAIQAGFRLAEPTLRRETVLIWNLWWVGRLQET